MNLAINLLWISTNDQTGAFVYVRNLLDQLLSLGSATSFLIITRWSDRHFFSQRYGRRSNVTIIISDIRNDLLFHPWRASRKLWSSWRGKEKQKENIIAQELNRLIKKYEVKKMFFPTQKIYPRGLLSIEYYVTVFDLQHEYWSENFSTAEINSRRDDLIYIRSTAKHIFAISEHTKSTLIKKINFPADKITVTPLAPSINRSAPRPISLPTLFLFYPAALWPHKNHCLVIEVLYRLANIYPDLQVVFSGLIKKKKLKEKLDVLIVKYGLKSRVHFLGFVSDEVLQFIYARASLLIFPSAFEGFGMPILEAYQHNLPVVAARNTSIAEVAGDAALLCETGNAVAFAAAIDILLKNDKVRASLEPKMTEQLKKFSWIQTAALTLANLINQ
ncbi:MAG: glycosyltransferase family 1 protein [Patescibacteria group bacterium]